MTSLSSSASAIRKLNDAMSRAGPSCGRWMMTDGVMAEGPEFVLLAVRAVQAFAALRIWAKPIGADALIPFARADIFAPGISAPILISSLR